MSRTEIDWMALEDQTTEQFHDPAFRDLGKKFVPGEGDNPEALIIGSAPGAQEEAQSRPFVGSCAVLRELMGLAELFSTPSNCGPPYAPNCWLTYAIKFRPPKNRKPTDAEIKAAQPYLRREWEAVSHPRLIIPIGSIATRAITGKRFATMRTGDVHYFTGRNTGKGHPTFAVWPMIDPLLAKQTNDDQIKELIENHWERLGAWRNAQCSSTR